MSLHMMWLHGSSGEVDPSPSWTQELTENVWHGTYSNGAPNEWQHDAEGLRILADVKGVGTGSTLVTANFHFPLLSLVEEERGGRQFTFLHGVAIDYRLTHHKSIHQYEEHQYWYDLTWGGSRIYQLGVWDGGRERSLRVIEVPESHEEVAYADERTYRTHWDTPLKIYRGLCVSIVLENRNQVRLNKKTEGGLRQIEDYSSAIHKDTYQSEYQILLSSVGIEIEPAGELPQPSSHKAPPSPTPRS